MLARMGLLSQVVGIGTFDISCSNVVLQEYGRIGNAYIFSKATKAQSGPFWL
jgi:hypothetical protein